MSIIRKCFTVCMLVFALFCFALPCLSAAPDPIPVGYKIVPTEKLELLKSNNANLVLKLAELEQRLALLRTPSTELVEQLVTARKELEQCKQELKSAKTSLESAETLQKEMLNSLMDLEKEIDAERKAWADKGKRLRRQRDTWLFLAGACLLGYIGK